MKRSLLFKLILCYIICISLLFFITNSLGAVFCDQVIKQQSLENLTKHSESLTNQYLEPLLNRKIKSKEFSYNIRREAKENDITIWFITSRGNVSIDTSDVVNKSKSNIFEADPEFINNPTSDGYTLPGFLEEESLYSTSTVNLGSSQYYLTVIQSESYYENLYNSIILRLNIIALIFCPIILLVFVLIYFLTIHPVHKITKAAMEYSKGHFSYPLDIKANDEYNELGTAIKYMAGEMNNLDDYQRKFIGNISHDFRSPLTSIKGYIQAILDGTIPYENQEKYLKIILFEAERLSGLMTNLLTLNSFDHSKKVLERNNFDINYIISKTAETYEGTCEKRKISFIFNFEEEKQIVWADQPRIQQVLNNLIDNAIKFSPTSSTIEISTKLKNDKVFISVKDHGCGIPSSSINKIWERFYKIDSSRGKDKKGTGLGLAITKEIITSHDENIDVISTEGVGTEFIFSLPPRHMTKVN